MPTRPLLAFLPVLAVATLARAAAPDAMLDEVVRSTRWMGQASLRVEAGGKVVYLDPVGVQRAPKDGDLVLVTHDHQDHWNAGDVAKVAKPTALVVAPFAVQDGTLSRTRRIAPGETFTEGGVQVQAVPAYNVVKTYHPREKGYVGYVLTVGGVRIWVAGDTERIPELKTFSADVAFVPLGQTYTMSGPEEAAQAALDVKARVAIPYHWGMYEGKREDALRFQELLAGKARVVILDAKR